MPTLDKFACYVLLATMDNHSAFATLDTMDGEVLPVFSTETTARAFQASYPPWSRCRVAHMDGAPLLEHLRRLMVQGVREVALDPIRLPNGQIQASGGGGLILQVLAAAEAGDGTTMV